MQCVTRRRITSRRRAVYVSQHDDAGYVVLVSAMLPQGHHEIPLAAPRHRRPDDEGAHVQAHAMETLHAAGLAMDGHWVDTGLAETYVTV